MTTPVSVTPARAPAKPRAEARVSSIRVARAALAELLTHPGAAGLSPLALGCLTVLTRFACDRESLESVGSTLSIREAQTLFAMKGISQADGELVLSALNMSGLLHLDSAVVSIPAMDRALQGESSALANRVAGWLKREAVTAPQRAERAPAVTAPAPAELPAPVPASAPAQTPATTSAAPAARPTAPVLAAADPLRAQAADKKPTAAKSTGGETRRFAATDAQPTRPEDDPVMVRILCEKDRTAELTAQYVDHLQQNFKRIDVLEQLKRAALWCESNPARRKTFAGLRRFLNSWLGSASRDAEVRQAVVRAGNQRNGFGQGGDYVPAAAEVAPKAAEASGAADDFADLLPSAAPTAAVDGRDDSQSAASQPAAAPVHDAPAPDAQRPPMSRAVLAARAGARSNGVRGAAPARTSFFAAR